MLQGLLQGSGGVPDHIREQAKGIDTRLLVNLLRGAAGKPTYHSFSFTSVAELVLWLNENSEKFLPVVCLPDFSIQQYHLVVQEAK